VVAQEILTNNFGRWWFGPSEKLLLQEAAAFLAVHSIVCVSELIKTPGAARRQKQALSQRNLFICCIQIRTRSPPLLCLLSPSDFARRVTTENTSSLWLRGSREVRKHHPLAELSAGAPATRRITDFFLFAKTGVESKFSF